MRISCSRFLLVINFITLVQCRDIVELVLPGFCNASQVFDAIGMVCKNCGENQVFDNETGACKCAVHFKLSTLPGGSNTACVPCPANHTSTSDRSACLPCSFRNCDGNCGDNAVKIERNWNGSLLDEPVCVPCVNGTEPSGDGNRCVPCHQNQLMGLSNCICPSDTHELLGGNCVPKTDLVGVPSDPSLTSTTFDNGIQIESDFLSTNLRAVIALCKVHHNQTACQILANACTYSHFSYDKATGPCSFYRQMSTSQNAPDYLPWLYYSEDSALTLFSKQRISTTYSVKSSNANVLNFSFVAFDPQGSFQQVAFTSGNPLQLCPDSEVKLSQAFRFGTKFSQTCQLKMAELTSRPSLLYDVYLQYRDTNSTKLVAVPVKVSNYKKSGQFVNQGSDSSSWQLTRRFFPVDKTTGVQGGKLLVVQYMSKVSISIRIARGEAGKILTPLVTIEYKTAEVVDSEDKLYTLVFEVNYDMDVSSTIEDLKISIGVFSALAAVWSSIQTWSWWRRSGKLTLDISALVKLLATACGALAHVFLAITYFAALYWFIVYKQQDVAFLMMPNDSLVFMVRSYVIAAFVLKLVDIVHLIARQIKIDIFFLDWERPPPSSQEKKRESVSIWRTYFVANEWNEIQTFRKQSVALTLFVTLFFLKVLGFENLAIANPSNHLTLAPEDEYSQPNAVFRFALGTSVYLTVVIVQIGLRLFIYERFVENKLQQFIDLCSLSNISVWIISDTRFGYYIHGRSAHGFADTDMETMCENLQKEAHDLCGHRGLLASSDQQVFQMTVPAKLVAFYDRVLIPIKSVAKDFRPTANFDQRQTFQAYHSMNRFLASYLDHAIRDLDYDVKDKTFLEKVLDMELHEPTERGIFYNDANNYFSTLLFYGSETTLSLFDLSLFAFLDFLVQDFVLSAVIAYLSARILAGIRYYLSRNNLGRKAFIDERFLI